MIKSKRGFTLIELLIGVLIIGVLAAIALPQYQKAVLKSRYSAMMPLAKSIANGNEMYYMEHGNYSEDPTALVVQGKAEYPNGTNILMYNEGGLSYVRATNDGVPSARYLVYQKHSANFADTTMCEAGNDRANALCQALGGQIVEGGNSSGESGWTAYLLTGSYGNMDQFAEASGNDSGDDTGTDPQTPACNEDEKPDDIVVNENKGATAKCINGKWKYEWTGGTVYDTEDYNNQRTVCESRAEYSCAGSEFKRRMNRCEAYAEGGCAGSTFSGENSSCYGAIANGCEGSTFSGPVSFCRALKDGACANSDFSGWGSYCEDGGNSPVSNGCAGSIFSGQLSFCKGYFGCTDAIIQAGASCKVQYSGGCDGAKYGVDPSGMNQGIGSCYGGNCPTGVPINNDNWDSTNGSYTITGWKGNYCDATAMVTGVCPNGSPTGSATTTTDKTTAAGWYGGYCDSLISGTCPSGSPKKDGGTW